MEKKKRIFAGTIAGYIVMVFTFLLFVLSARHALGGWLNLAFILFSEFLAVRIYTETENRAVKGNGLFLRAGAYTVSVLYVIFTVALLIVCEIIEISLKGLLIIHTGAIALAALLYLMIFLFAHRITKSYDHAADMSRRLDVLKTRLKDMQQSRDSTPYALALQALYREFEDLWLSPRHEEVLAMLENCISELGAVPDIEKEASLQRVEELVQEVLKVKKRHAPEVCADDKS